MKKSVLVLLYLLLTFLTCPINISGQGSASKTLSISVNSSTLTATVAPHDRAVVGQVYASFSGSGNGGAIISFNGGVAPYACSITSGSLPAGMTMSEVTPIYPAGLCILNGTPTTAGSYPLTVKVTDNLSSTTSQSLTFLVLSSSLPTFSNQNSTTTATTATVTWTTNVATTSQVCWQYYGYSNCTPETDLAGVTSHSVTISGLVPSLNVFQYACVGRGISGGVPVDWLRNSDGQVSTFATAGGTSTGSQDFAFFQFGSHNVIPGYPLNVGIYAQPISGVTTTNNWSVVVTCNTGCAGGLLSGSHMQVHWPDIQDSTGGGSVSTTTTTDDTFNSGGNATFTQFFVNTNVGSTTPTGSYILTVTMTQAPAGASHSFNWVMNVANSTFSSGTPSSYPAIPQLSLWTSQMTTYGSSWCNSNNPIDPPPNEQGVWYYDGTNTFFQIQDYTGNASPWAACAQAVIGQYRPYVGSEVGYEVFPHGLYRDCVTLVTASSCTALHNLATNIYSGNLLAGGIMPSDQANVREICYEAGAARLDYDAGGATSLTKVKNAITFCLNDVDQIVNGDTTGFQTFEEGFFDGVMAETLLDYYNDPNTGNHNDPRVPQALKLLADHLWNTAWFPWNGTNGSFWYSPYNFNVGIPNQGCNGCDMQALNLLTMPFWGWLWRNTGLQQYQLEGDTAWASGVTDPTSGGIGWSGKNFSQQYRWSFSYVKYRQP